MNSPKGDGNSLNSLILYISAIVREMNSPKGDGNAALLLLICSVNF